jgi:anti-anti-sigma factor
MMPKAISTDRLTVQLFGELDVVSAPRLEQRLDRLRREGAQTLMTLDLSGVEFLGAWDSACSSAPIRHCRRQAVGCCVRRPTGIVSRVLA